MKKPMVIGGLVAILLIGACIAVYILYSGSMTATGSADNTTATIQANSVVGNPVNSTDNNTSRTSPWGITGSGPVYSISLGEDDTLYSFTGDYGNDIYAMGPNGTVKWEYTVPGQWRAINRFNNPMSQYGTNQRIDISGYNNPKDTWNYMYGPNFYEPLFTSDNGNLYLYLRESRTTFWNYMINETHPFRPGVNDWGLKEKVLAISDGKLLWEKTISPEHHMFDYPGLSVKNGRLYIFDDYALTVLGENGTQLFKIDDVSYQPSVDENGFIYLVPAVLSPAQPDSFDGDSGYKEPSNTVVSYNPDGTLRWQIKVPGRILRPDLVSQVGMHGGLIMAGRSALDALPMYQNGTLYITITDGVEALNVDGTRIWTKQYEDLSALLIPEMPIDSYGNVYVYAGDQIHIISPDGTEQVQSTGNYPPASGDAGTGVVYNVAWSITDTPSYTDENGKLRPRNYTLEDMFYVNVSAYDQLNGKALWHFSIVPDAAYATLDSGNNKKLVSPYIDENMGWMQGAYPYGDIQILPGSNAVYVNYQAATYEWPIVLNQSRCRYASMLYALDKTNGTVIWQKPLDSLATSMAVGNGTAYYGTNDGRIANASGIFGSLTAGGGTVRTIGEVAAGGTAATAVVFILIKFFGIGAVARAKRQLDTNENRNSIWKYIVEHPGSTMYDLSHEMGMNVGTVRYHLFILGANHRIVSQKADGKFIRYFTNSGSYTIDEQYVLSLARREGIGKILCTLLEKPGLSNGELSLELNMRESNVSRYVAELIKKGILIKNPMSDGRSSFEIKNEYKKHVAFALERINGQ